MSKKNRYQKSCLILGAGASKGAHTALGKSPPLDSEFLTIAKELLSKKGKSKDITKAAKNEWKGLIRLFSNLGINKKSLNLWRLESLTTYLEARVNLNFENKQGRPQRYKKAIEKLNRIVCYVLAQTGGTQTCKTHKAMINLLNPKCIISFNYDLIVDQTLFQINKLSYMSKYYSKGKTVRIWKNRKWSTRKWYDKRRPSLKGINLYKLHGSMHWQKLKKSKGYVISSVDAFPPKKNNILNFKKPPTNPLIIPPIAAKMSLADNHLKALWSKAHKDLRLASVWIIWGYSFPQTDSITTVLLRTFIKESRGKKKRIIIINPDQTVAQRVKLLLGKVNVTQYYSALDFLMDNDKVNL